MKNIKLFILVFFSCSTFCKAQSELKVLQASLPKISDSLNYVDVLNRVAILLYEKNIDSTFYYSRKAREIADRLDYAKGKADALNNLGIFFDIKGNTQLALRYYDQAYAAYTQLNDSVNRVQTLMNIAMVYRETGKDQRAIQRYKAALHLGGQLRNDSIMSLTIVNYLLQYSKELSRDSTVRLIAKAKHIAAKYEDERVLLALDQLIAEDLMAQGKRKEGLDLLDSTINRAIRKKLYFVSMDVLAGMGNQLDAVNSERAADYYQMGLDIATRQDYLIYRQLMARKLFEFYTRFKNSPKAIAYSRLLIELHDEQEKVDNTSSIDYLDYALKEQQVNSLVQRSKYQGYLLFLVVIACLLAVAFIIAIKQNLKRTRRLAVLARRQNTEMKKALGALEQSQADNTRMLKIAAHDLRNPIGGMFSIASLMLDDPDRPEEDREMLGMLKTSGQNALELVNELLEVQFTTEELKKEPVDIGDMLQYCVSLLLNKAEAKQQRIELSTQEFTLLASREKLWRVVSNLIANAIKFSPVDGTIEVSMDSTDSKVLISVKDHGIGIPPELQDKIFDLFTEAQRPGTTGEQSFGLGLAISKQIVEAHNGKIWFESTVGGGTTFFVELYKSV